VADGTRRETLDKAIELRERVENATGPLPFLLLLNKMDRLVEWAVEQRAVEDLSRHDWTWIKTSAKTGEGVDLAFRTIAERVADIHVVGSTV
jgi:50S ribosomal subunit-associated GTPase HflX